MSEKNTKPKSDMDRMLSGMNKGGSIGSLGGPWGSGLGTLIGAAVSVALSRATKSGEASNDETVPREVTVWDVISDRNRPWLRAARSIILGAMLFLCLDVLLVTLSRTTWFSGLSGWVPSWQWLVEFWRPLIPAFDVAEHGMTVRGFAARVPLVLHGLAIGWTSTSAVALSALFCVICLPHGTWQQVFKWWSAKRLLKTGLYAAAGFAVCVAILFFGVLLISDGPKNTIYRSYNLQK